MGVPKKATRSSKRGGQSVSTASMCEGLEQLGNSDNDTNYEEIETCPVTFTGKKKKSSKKSNPFYLDDDASFNNINTDSFEEDATAQEEEDDASTIVFCGKKKSSKKKSQSAFNILQEESVSDGKQRLTESDKEIEGTKSKQVHVDPLGISKANSKKKKGGNTYQEDDEIDKILAELSDAAPIPSNTALPPPGEMLQVEPEPKGKTKKKKGGKKTEGKDEIDTILAELGEGLRTSKPDPASSPQEEKDQDLLEAREDIPEKETVEGVVESAAAKKKKKKKEKEKEKKGVAAAAAGPVFVERQETKADGKGKGDKKVPKHVREMQERLAKLKEVEERKKREEEEKLRKEEEERLRLEELERLAEERKRLKKEREKEKMLKKKQEGKLLTGKQKEEARRLEKMRKQILTNAGGLPLPGGETAMDGTKRPKYQTKKAKQQSHGNDNPVSATTEISDVKEAEHEIIPEVDSLETEKVEELDSSNSDDKSEAVDAEENEIEDDEDGDDWDAKSWDEDDLRLPGRSAFSDEEVDGQPKALARKPKKIAQAAGCDSGALSVASKRTPINAPAVSKVEDINIRDPEYESKEKSCQEKKEAQKPVAMPDKSERNLRSPICCIMGHVDTGKTKLLDCIRGTNVQEGEARGITQQIGATYFPAENIRERTRELKADATLKVPGLIVIDTPGHESFTNLRSRGSGLCDIAILAVDIMHGLKQQTIESLNLLKMRNTEFIIALNKVDLLYGWKTCSNAPIQKAMTQQNADVKLQFKQRVIQIVTQFKEQGVNTELYYKNKDMGKDTFSIVPTSAISGEGIPDLLLLLVQWAQRTMVERLTFSNEVQCTVLEVKVIEGHGTTIDVILVNGVLHEGDQIVVCGMLGEPVVTSIRALLTPHPMKELRVKGTYLHHKEIKAAQCIKITAQGLEHAIAGTSLYVVGPDDDVDHIKEAAMEDMRSVMSRIDKGGEGVYVQASTLGSLEALLEHLKSPDVSIPVSGIGIGPIHKKDVMKASVMLEKKKEYAAIFAFDVKVTQEARELADEYGVKIFIADVMYHLSHQFKAYIDHLKEEKKKEVADEAVFPCRLKILPHVFNTKDPIILGVEVLDGIARVGTLICVPPLASRDMVEIGRIASIRNNDKPVGSAKRGQTVTVQIVGSNSEERQKMFGRHFDVGDELVSKISRRSIDVLKEHFRKDLSVEEWRLVVDLKKKLRIQ
ncbi:unnamed protein product [Cuscuta campestris]|uniref:Eukaryotic translation initiation factor 5B n=1 Tax=Cuscuta campestris TaxID=132261 RepID=A0A484KVS8_9ASTE|nr:unnamed protein product [Cuscuta campestris]